MRSLLCGPGSNRAGRSPPRVRCGLSPWSVVRFFRLTLPGSGAGVLSPYGVLLHLHLRLPRTSTLVESSCQSHADAVLLVSQRRTIAFTIHGHR